jgi:outer membrane protein assembly factor BamB
MTTFLRFVLIGMLLLASVPALAENWPQFRGPDGQGRSAETDLPLKWSATDNIAWRAELPGEGWSSPIVWGDRVFVTTATDEGVSCRVLCLDRRTGAVQWNHEVFQQQPRRKEGKNSYATPTPITDGQRVYAVFGDGSMVALTLDGRVEWTNRDIKFYSQHGLGASPILVGDLLVMPFDGSSEGPDKQVGWKIPWGDAVLLAVNKHDGKEVWRGNRGKSRIAHVTPSLLARDGQSQIISGAGDVVQGFDPHSGKLIWSVYSQGEGVVPSIVLGDDLVYSCSGFEEPTIRAIRPDGEGDVTKTHIVWEQKTGVPNQPSLLYAKPYLYSITDNGVVACFDGETGKVQWQKRIGGNHSASPVWAEGRIYSLSENGETVVFAAGKKFEELARNALDARCQASLAVSQGQLFVRTDRHLVCIGKK